MQKLPTPNPLTIQLITSLFNIKSPIFEETFTSFGITKPEDIAPLGDKPYIDSNGNPGEDSELYCLKHNLLTDGDDEPFIDDNIDILLNNLASTED